MRSTLTRLLCVDAHRDPADAAVIANSVESPLDWAAPAFATVVTVTVTLGLARIIAMALGLAP